METIANKLESSGFPTFRLRIPLHYQRKRKTVSTDRLKQLKTIIQNVVTADSILQQRNGIEHINLVDFMRNGKAF